MTGIEYLDGPAPVAPPPSRSPRRGRPVAVLVLVGLVLAGLLVARAVTSGGRGTPAKPVPTYALAECTTALTEVPVVEQSQGARVTIALPDLSGARATDCSKQASACPEADDGQNACTTTSTLPAAVLTAVRARFPSARVVATRTERIRGNGRLWYRYVRFRLPSSRTDLVVEVVDGHSGTADAGEWDDGSGLLARASVTRGKVTTLVTTDAPSGSRSQLDNQYALARDPALAAG